MRLKDSVDGAHKGSVGWYMRPSPTGVHRSLWHTAPPLQVPPLNKGQWSLPCLDNCAQQSPPL
jgi:hypothetical protein